MAVDDSGYIHRTHDELPVVEQLGNEGVVAVNAGGQPGDGQSEGPGSGDRGHCDADGLCGARDDGNGRPPVGDDRSSSVLTIDRYALRAASLPRQRQGGACYGSRKPRRSVLHPQ